MRRLYGRNSTATTFELMNLVIAFTNGGQYVVLKVRKFFEVCWPLAYAKELVNTIV